MRLSASIAHTPWNAQRRAWVTEILRRVQGGCSVSVQADNRPEERRKREGYWPNVRRSFERCLIQDPQATHVQPMQDDMLPCPDYLEQLAGAVAARPDALIAVFTIRPFALKAREAGQSWFVSEDGAWGGSMVFPRAMAEDFLRWERRHVDPAYRHDDGRVAKYAQAHGIPIWHTVPCLIEHVGADESQIGHAPRMFGRSRRASLLIGAGEVIDWSRGTEAPLRNGFKGEL